MSNIAVLNKVHSVYKERLGNKKSASVYIKEEEYSLLTLRFIKLEDDELENSAISFLIDNHKVYQVIDSQTIELMDINDFQKVLAKEVKYLNQLFLHFSESVDTVEDCLYELTNLRTLNTEIFNLKRDILKVNRAIERVTHVLKEFSISESELLDHIHSDFFGVIHESELGVNKGKSLLEKLDSCFTYLVSLKNDNLNKNIYVLSIVSGIFLPLNLIVGFFGMNTTGLFLADHVNGTLIVFYIILGIFSFLIIGFPILHFIDKKIISKFLGRYGVYNKLSKKIEKLTSEFNILAD